MKKLSSNLGMQKLARIYGLDRQDGLYIINKRDKTQKRYFKCSCCGKTFDLENSLDYIDAAEQWESLGGKCYACGHGLGTKESFPCHIKK